MKKGFIKQKSLSVMERLMNQSLTVKISVFIYLIVIILFLALLDAHLNGGCQRSTPNC